KNFAKKLERPLIVVGGLRPDRRKGVLSWLSHQQCPVYAEAGSGLRGCKELSSIELYTGEKLARVSEFDSVLRIGHIPTLRMWRDLEKAHLPVLSISDLPFSGLSRTETKMIPIAPELFSSDVRFQHSQIEDVMARDRRNLNHLEKLIEEFPQSEI